MQELGRHYNETWSFVDHWALFFFFLKIIGELCSCSRVYSYICVGTCVLENIEAHLPCLTAETKMSQVMVPGLNELIVWGVEGRVVL